MHVLLIGPAGMLGGKLTRRLLADGDLAGRPLARLTLAEQLAHLYDQYLTYRPRLILDWESGQGGDDLQAELWRRIRQELGPHHLAARVVVGSALATIA